MPHKHTVEQHWYSQQVGVCVSAAEGAAATEWQMPGDGQNIQARGPSTALVHSLLREAAVR